MISDVGSNVSNPLDYQSIFTHAPIALAISRERKILECNNRMLEVFSATREQLVHESFSVLYPTQVDFEKTGVRTIGIFKNEGRYANDRIMRRLNGELFWCYMAGHTFDTLDPFKLVIWSFMDLSSTKSVTSSLQTPLTPREREICKLLIDNHTSKEIGKALAISPRTVDTYRASLMRKYSVATTADLIQKLLYHP